MNKPALVDMVRQSALALGVDPAVACAVVEQESRWDCFAIRYEPRFYDEYVAPHIEEWHLTDTEARLRAFSFGLFQDMGQVARENGFTEPLVYMLHPSYGIPVGVAVLKKKLDAHPENLHDGLQSYNGGAAPDYAAQVMERMAKYQQSAGASQT
jgi:soluble lytic murein transglycosylase-like protein